MTDINFDEVKDGELLKWDTVGTKLVGILKSYKQQRTAMGDGNVYEVQTKDGIVPFFATTLLHKKLQGINTGELVSIEYTHTTKTQAGTTLKHFKVGHTAPTEANLKAIGIEMFKDVDGDDLSQDALNKF